MKFVHLPEGGVFDQACLESKLYKPEIFLLWIRAWCWCWCLEYSRVEHNLENGRTVFIIRLTWKSQITSMVVLWLWSSPSTGGLNLILLSPNVKIVTKDMKISNSAFMLVLCLPNLKAHLRLGACILSYWVRGVNIVTKDWYENL